MGLIIELTNTTTCREFLDSLDQAFAGKMDKPIEVEMCRPEDYPLEVTRVKFIDQGNFVELRMFE